jgi:RHS repeat-associated protein
MGRLEFNMSLDLDPADLNLDTTLYNAVAVYYTDFSTPAADAKYDVFLFDVDDAANEAVARGTITYSENKQIKWVHVLLNASGSPLTGPVNCAIMSVNKNVGPDSLVKISCTITAKSQLPTTQTSSILSVSPTVGYAAGGIGLFYFGRRYYDPELGMFTSTDPADQYWNSYCYVGNNPVNNIDADGEYGTPIILATGVVGEAIYTAAELAILAKLATLYAQLFALEATTVTTSTVTTAVTLLKVAAMLKVVSTVGQVVQQIGDFGSKLFGNTNANVSMNENAKAGEGTGQGAAEEKQVGPTKEAEGNASQDHPLTKGEIKELQKEISKDGFKNIESLKTPRGKGAGKYDLYKKPNGDVVVKPKGGSGPGEPTGYNVKR